MVSTLISFQGTQFTRTKTQSSSQKAQQAQHNKAGDQTRGKNTFPRQVEMLKLAGMA